MAPASAADASAAMELKERAVRLVFESDRPIAQVARDLGINKEALRHWVRHRDLLLQLGSADANLVRLAERVDALITGSARDGLGQEPGFY